MDRRPHDAKGAHYVIANSFDRMLFHQRHVLVSRRMGSRYGVNAVARDQFFGKIRIADIAHRGGRSVAQFAAQTENAILRAVERQKAGGLYTGPRFNAASATYTASIRWNPPRP